MRREPEQIEQFIETIFPSQDPKVLELAQKDVKVSEKPGMDTSEAVVLILAVLAMFLFLGGLMVSRKDGPLRPMILQANVSVDWSRVAHGCQVQPLLQQYRRRRQAVATTVRSPGALIRMDTFDTL